MSTITLIKEAIIALKDRTGSSIPAINKYLEAEKKTNVKKHILKAALKRGVDTGVLVQVKNSYKLSAEAKKPVKAAPAPKAVVVVVKPKVVKKKTTTVTKKAAPVKKAVTAVSKKSEAKKPVAKKSTTAKKALAKPAVAKKESTTKKAASAKKPKAKKAVKEAPKKQ